MRTEEGVTKPYVYRERSIAQRWACARNCKKYFLKGVVVHLRGMIRAGVQRDPRISTLWEDSGSVTLSEARALEHASDIIETVLRKWDGRNATSKTHYIKLRGPGATG